MRKATSGKLPKQTIRDQLTELMDGHWATLTDIAREASRKRGVSKKTVDRVGDEIAIHREAIPDGSLRRTPKAPESVEAK